MSVCEACNSARLPCRFRDREKYFAERSKLVSSSSKSVATARQQIDMVMTTDVLPSQPSNSSSHTNGTVTRVSPKRNMTYHPYHHHISHQPRSNSMPLASPPPPPPPTPSPLFDPKYPDRPRSQLMLPFINAFCDNLSIWFPFMAFDETIKRFLMHDLPVLQANCIAALAVRYVDLPEVIQWGVSRATDDYAYAAKVT